MINNLDNVEHKGLNNNPLDDGLPIIPGKTDKASEWMRCVLYISAIMGGYQVQLKNNIIDPISDQNDISKALSPFEKEIEKLLGMKPDDKKDPTSPTTDDARAFANAFKNFADKEEAFYKKWGGEDMKKSHPELYNLAQKGHALYEKISHIKTDCNHTDAPDLGSLINHVLEDPHGAAANDLRDQLKAWITKKTPGGEPIENQLDIMENQGYSDGTPGLKDYNDLYLTPTNEDYNNKLTEGAKKIETIQQIVQKLIGNMTQLFANARGNQLVR